MYGIVFNSSTFIYVKCVRRVRFSWQCPSKQIEINIRNKVRTPIVLRKVFQVNNNKLYMYYIKFFWKCIINLYIQYCTHEILYILYYNIFCEIRAGRQQSEVGTNKLRVLFFLPVLSIYYHTCRYPKRIPWNVTAVRVHKLKHPQ